MPDRTRRFAPRPREYGGYYRDASYLYEAEAAPPAWLEGLQSAVGSFMSAREARKAEAAQREQDELRRVVQDEELRGVGIMRGQAPGLEASDGRRVELRGRAPADMIGTTSTGRPGSRTTGVGDGTERSELGSFRQVSDSYYVDEAMTPDARAKRERDEAARAAGLQQGVTKALMRRIRSGDPEAIADAAAAGMPAATINLLTPEEAPEAKEDTATAAYNRRIGALRADQEMGVGQFKPETPGRGGSGRGDEPSMAITSPTDARRYAEQAIEQALSSFSGQEDRVDGNSVYHTAAFILKGLGLGENPLVLRELRARAGNALTAQRQKAAQEAAKPKGRTYMPNIPPR